MPDRVQVSARIRQMPRIRMHADEVFTDVALVHRLLAAQFPHWADLPIEPVASSGTDHDIYRLGADLCVRLPRIGWATAQASREAEWLPRLAPHLDTAGAFARQPRKRVARSRPADRGTRPAQIGSRSRAIRC
jgi:aminoglycoside phosphotransferase (APT) family kinase protein